MIFNSILIANRGEIACRIIKTAKEMGIRSIAVYVDADKDSLFVKQADESIRLEDGGYLDGDQIFISGITEIDTTWFGFDAPTKFNAWEVLNPIGIKVELVAKRNN